MPFRHPWQRHRLKDENHRILRRFLQESPIFLFQFLFSRPVYRQGTQTSIKQGFLFIEEGLGPQRATNIGGDARDMWGC